MRLPLDERETVISFGRTDKTASVYTSDERIMNKLDKYVAMGTGWEHKWSETCQGDVVSKTYECPVEFISFRSKKKIYTEEQKKKMAEHLVKARQNQF